MYLSTVYGCVVASDIDLNMPPVSNGATPELTLRRSGREYETGWEPVKSDLISQWWDDVQDHGYLSARTPTGYRLRFHDVCDFDLNAELSQVEWRPAPSADPGLIPVLAAGTLMALRFMLRDELVLHASAVEVYGHGLAFAGQPRMGKSTMAALMCASGAQLLTDDVGRVIFGADGIRLARGGGETRMRDSVVASASLTIKPDITSRTTGDGRLALSLPVSSGAAVPLDAILIPVTSGACTEVELRTLKPIQAATVLDRFPRVEGLIDRALLDRRFNMAVDLVEQVPVFTMVLPSKVPVHIGLQLVEKLGW